MPAPLPFCRLKNNQPDPITLPFPLAGVLAGGETILTRYNQARLLFLLNGDGPADQCRQLQLSTGPRSAAEADFSRHSPGRDYFRGIVRTTDAAATAAVFAQAGGSFPGVRLDQLQPGAYDLDVVIKGYARDVAPGSVAVYRRRAVVAVLQDGTLGGLQLAGTLGTDVEYDAGMNGAVNSPGGVYAFGVLVTGVAATNIDWAVDVAVTSVNWAS